MNSACEIEPPRRRTALRAVLVPDGLKNILFFVGVVHPPGTN